ncbi:MAG: VWA domain-containing protein [Colwellia sp.]|nr:VWA domain-containing protein [Colwellia sp.]
MSDFHFLRPWWLIAILVLMFALNLLKKYRLSQSGWQQLLPKHLANVLVDGQQQRQSLSLSLPFIIGLLAITALAGPTWKKLPQPVYQIARGSVLIMDMSYSMYATDISPNRLTRARFKAIDILEQLNEGEIGLIAYAGDAFTISPLTDDINNIKLLLPSLTPELMPELGSNPYAALTLAHDMLTNAGHAKGDIYWFTDGIDNIDIQDITDWSRSNNHRLNILGIGSKTGAPIKLNTGELMKDNSGAIIVPKLSIAALQGSAKRGRGFYSTITNNNDDIEQLLKQPVNIEEHQKKESANTGDQWQEVGPYLLLLLLPLLLPYFRRGRLLAILPLCLFLTPIDKSYAQEANAANEEATTSSKEAAERSFFQDTWQDLWKTKDQQAQKQFNNQAYQQAAGNFEDKLWQGSAHYRAGDYEQALQAFQQQTTAEALYNQGNALAKLERYDEAIEAYTQVLKNNAQHSDAQANKTYLEEMKKQQEQQKQENNKEQSDEKKQDQDNKDQDKDQDKEQQKSDDDSQQNPSEQDQNKNQESESEQEKSQQEKEQEQKEQDEKEKQAQENEANKDDENQPEQTPAQLRAAEKLAEETKQKHQQLLNKVTDDPYMLLRNKMQLEYQKRRHNRSSAKGTKQW